MKGFGPFRLIDSIREYGAGETITTLCRLENRRSVLGEISLSAILVELAAQTCGLIERLDSRSAGPVDCFLGKVRQMDFGGLPGWSDTVKTSARKVCADGRMSLFRGRLDTEEGLALADFELLMCTVESVGGNRKQRVHYWQDYLLGLLNTLPRDSSTGKDP